MAEKCRGKRLLARITLMTLDGHLLFCGVRVQGVPSALIFKCVTTACASLLAGLGAVRFAYSARRTVSASTKWQICNSSRLTFSASLHYTSCFWKNLGRITLVARSGYEVFPPTRTIRGRVRIPLESYIFCFISVFVLSCITNGLVMCWSQSKEFQLSVTLIVSG
jgi:hypothetical protein